MTIEMANAVYDILVDLGGAVEESRDSFVFHHTRNECDEWRFQGKFGFGGKYRSKSNKIDFYQEDYTRERQKLSDEINEKLRQIGTL